MLQEKNGFYTTVMNVVKGKNIEILKILDFHGVIFSF